MNRNELKKLNDNKLDKAVKIQGTNHDRKRKMNHLSVINAKRMLNANKSVADVAEHYGVAESTIRYNTDAEYRARKLEKASGKHTGNTNHNKEDRVAYKRQLLNRRVKLITAA